MNRFERRVSNFIHKMSIKKQLLLVFILTAAIIFVANLVIFIEIDKQMGSVDAVYDSNEQNNELLALVENVQDSMTVYLQVKSTDVMEGYYRAVYDLTDVLDSMDTTIQGNVAPAARDDIKNMIYAYLKLADETIQGKRGRNVERYSVNYEEASTMFLYIKDSITSLNEQQFRQNTEEYSELRISMKVLEVTSFVALGFAFLIGMVLVILFTERITFPITDLAERAGRISGGDFDVEIPTSNWTDEISILSKAFSGMLVSIKDYMAQEKKNIETERDLRERELTMEAEIKEARLKYFQAQINPHFLFNTLNAGMQLAMLESAPRTGEFLKNVSEFFRYNINKDNGGSTIGEEVSLVDYYVEILKVRFGDELELVKDVDESVYGLYIPKMVLQPIVENCVNHGVRETERKGIIYLTIYRQNGEVLISIADNGVGMSKELIDSILSGNYVPDENSAESNGVGIRSVINRLKLFYNRDDVIEIVSEGKDQGTEVIIHVQDNAG
ncbi:MAG: histidine kinase [Lachnospiraceae bacterium]|nr:histidine kinase [Lachnospiraceae bacterium]